MAGINEKYPDVLDDPAIVCGSCDPNSQANAQKNSRYSTIWLVTDVAAPGGAGIEIAAGDKGDFFSYNQGEPFPGGLGGDGVEAGDATAAETDMLADEECMFAGFAYSFKLGNLKQLALTGGAGGTLTTVVEPFEFHNLGQYYNNAARELIGTMAALSIVQKNNCTVALAKPEHAPPSMGPFNGDGYGPNTGVVGAEATFRAAVVLPDPTKSVASRRPLFRLSVPRDLQITENAADAPTPTVGTDVVVMPIEMRIIGEARATDGRC